MKLHRIGIVGLLIAAAGCAGEPSEVGPTPPNPPPPIGPEVPPPPPATSKLPCAIDTILQARCQSCHASTPRYGAPMALVTLDDLHAPSKSDPSQTVLERVAARIVDPRQPMPPTGELVAAEREALTTWIGEGAPESTEPSCTPTTPPPPPTIGPQALPCTPSQTITAHESGSTSPYSVPVNAPNLYVCYTMRSPFGAGEQATAWAPVIGDERVLHHWILYGTKTPQTDGGVGPCRMPGDAVFLAGWAPGGGNWVMPSDVSVELPGQDQWLILQIHYHNDAHYTDALDASGVALCTTDTPRQKVAGFFTLGSVRIDIPPNARGVEVTGECGSALTRFMAQPVQILGSFPHMHLRGSHFRSEIQRNGTGAIETVLDETFSFDNQRGYAHDPPIELRPGDAIRTTCTYDNYYPDRVRFGERTEDEMCFDFKLIYPISMFQGNRTCGLL